MVSGQFSGSSDATDQLPLQLPEQGEYDLTLRVQDSLGRTVSEYTLNGDSTATAQRPVLVDLENPVIANVHPQQQAVPPVNNAYVLQVSADISDLHLVDSAVTARLSNGGALITPVQVIRPDAPSNTYLFEFLVEAGSYELILNAADAAGHSQSQVVPSVTVAPWQVPTVAISTQDGVTDLGSGQDTILVFDFSEPVTGFAAEDIVLTAASGGDAGTLSGLAEQSPGRWTAVYRAPIGVDTGVSLSVTADSYVSAATQLAGSAASLTLEVIGSPLTASVSLPEGNEVSRIGTIAVTFTFNRPVSGEVVPLPEEGVWSNIRKNPAMTEITYDFSPQALAVGTHQVGVAAGYLDDYGNAGLAASLPVTVTNIAPVIGADFSLFEQGGQVVMDVDITDAESALASVRYTVLDLPGSPITVEKTLADGNLSRLSFDAAQLGGAQSFRVQIEVTDDAGAVVNRELAVDIAQAAVTLTVPGSQLSGGQLLLTSADPSFTVSTEIPVGSRASVAGYTLTLVARDSAQSDIVVSGQFSGSSDATDQLPLQLPEQGEYDLTLRVQDSLGRTVSEYTLNGESTATAQLPVLVDLEQPQILNVHTVQLPLAPEAGKYFIRATADIVDLNLDSSKIISILDNGVEQIAALSFSAPPDHSDTYSFDFNVAPGNYNLIIKAADLAGNEKISTTESIVVESWTVPTMSMSVRDPDTAEVGGGKTIWLDLHFSEMVDGFSQDDLIATASAGGEAGIFSEFNQLSATHWQVRYTAPAGVDTDIAIQVSEGSYTAADDYMPGSGSNLSLTVIGTPLLTSISFQDGNTQVIKGEIIEVTIVFNRPVLTEPVLTPANTEFVSFWSAPVINADRTAFTFELDTTELDYGESVIGVEAGDQDQYGNMGQSVTAMLTVN